MEDAATYQMRCQEEQRRTPSCSLLRWTAGPWVLETSGGQTRSTRIKILTHCEMLVIIQFLLLTAWYGCNLDVR